jgi:hypothetical protein
MKCLNWSDFKNTCITIKGLSIQFEDLGVQYRVYGPDSNNLTWEITLDKLLDDGTVNPDATDFETTVKPTANGKIALAQLDTDGAILSRVKVAPTGWNFNYRMVELQLSTVGGIVNNDQNGNPVGDATITIYDVNGAVITDPALQGNAVKTVVDLEPPYNICVAGGTLRMDSMPSSDVILNVIAVPDVPVNMGGSKNFVQNVNLSYIDGQTGLDANGRAAKMLNYSPVYHTNKFRFQFNHVAGYQLWVAILMEIYRQ